MLIYFKTWIKQFKEKVSRYGDLANDMQDDKSFPRKNEYSEILNYLGMVNACDDAIDTFKDAWKDYQSNPQSSINLKYT